MQKKCHLPFIEHFLLDNDTFHCYSIARADLEEEGGGAGKSQVAIDFLINSSTNPIREAIGPSRPNCFSKEILSEIRW